MVKNAIIFKAQVKGVRIMVAIILGAGMSKRMNRNKLLIKFKGKYLIEIIIEKVLKCNFNEVILVYKDKEIKEIGEGYKIKTIFNADYYKGQSESIKIALKNIGSNEDFMFFTSDEPLLKIESIKELLDTFKKNKGIIVPRVESGNKSPVIFESIYKKDLLKINGDVGGRDVIKGNRNNVTFLDFFDEDEFFDIDSEEDLEYIVKKYGK